MAAGKWRGLRKTLLRKTKYEPDQIEATSLRRCLNYWDLSAIGVGSTLGVGVYVIIGPVALNLAGPSVVLSFLIAAVAALFAGLCYAEFGARIPRAGAAYSYTYFALGELAAFLVGWINIFDAMFGTATIARGVSLHMDTLLNTTMSEWFTSIAPISVNFVSPFFDFFACLIVFIMGAVLAFGVKEGALVNNVFSAANMVFVLFIVVCGAFAVNPNNWYLSLEDVPPEHGVGGFFPFGVLGTLKGATICFYGFVGFDSICAAGEEVLEPRRVIPFTILSVLGVTFLCYTSVSIVISMMIPYYLTDNVIAIAEAFTYVQWGWAWWIVGVGSLFGLYASLFGGMFCLTRLMYSMSGDGLLLQCLSRVTTSRQSPAILTVGCTLVIGIMAGLVEVQPLLLMLCLGTLISYTTVAIGVIILRYGSDYTPGEPKYLRQIFGLGRSPTEYSSRIVKVSLLLFVFIGLSSALIVFHVQRPLIPVSILSILAFVLLLEIMVQPQVKEDIYFKTPLVPLVPCISIYTNLHLMVLISFQTWIRVAVWIVIGLIIYFITICCCKRPDKNKLANNIRVSYMHSLTNRNGKPPVQIIVESPTPPETLTRISDYGGEIQREDIIQVETEDAVRNNVVPITTAIKTEEIIMHQSYIENNEEKEAKIIDLLDQVLQAEEDSYGEAISVKEQNDEDVCYTENVIQRKSLSELSDAGSDASVGNHGLSKYDVVAQVHREDLPKVSEEEEKSERGDVIDSDEINEHEKVTAFNDNDSRTDESGYSDTIDRNAIGESLEESKEEISSIPIPPPLPKYEILFKNPNFMKSYTVGAKRNPAPPIDEEEMNKPRESINSVKSNSSVGDGNLAFGSDRQIHFMSKLNIIFQNKITNGDDEEPRKRSHSTGNVVENTDFLISQDRSPLFLALKNEIISKEPAQSLRSSTEELSETSKPPINAEDKSDAEQHQEEEADASLSKEAFKSKLASIYATGGPQLQKPRLVKYNPPVPDDQADASSTESIAKLPKIEKNDTLKRQKDKFSAVLNSIRQSYSKDDVV